LFIASISKPKLNRYTELSLPRVMKKYDIFDYAHILILLGEDEKSAQEAFRRLYDHRAQHIYYVSRKILRSDDMARDVTQDVFLTIWQKRMQLSHILNFEAYIYAMARTSINMVIRGKVYDEIARRHQAQMSLEKDDPFKEQYAVQLDEIVEHLPPRAKKIFLMAKIQGLKYEEIAEKLNITVHAVNYYMKKSFKIINERKQDLTILFLSSALLENIIEKVI
jgi:RNA polymerase sigma factor (sigma-70 family)